VEQQEQLGHTSIVLTADTYTSVLMILHFKVAEATARLVLAAAAKDPGSRYRRRKRAHRSPQRRRLRRGRHRCGPNDPAIQTDDGKRAPT
jgi:hypothetical protein